MTTIGTLFSGGEGVGCGAKAAGLTHAWGIEYADDIAAVARQNGFNVLTADVTQVDPRDFAPVDVLHASPPCPNFSVAKQDRVETESDVALSEAVCRFIRTLRPAVFTLENVYGYRKSESFRRIVAALHGLGYGWDWWHLNAADFGVPQTRKRLVLVARRDGTRPQHPTAIHAPAEDIAPLFDHRQPWVGWYEAIEDLIPTLPESQFACFQMDYSESVEGCMLLCDDSKNTTSLFGEPSFTITASNGSSMRARVPPDRVVAMTPRALARFQSFPDWYELPESRALACRVIGNAVPPLLYQRVLEEVLP